MKKKFFLLIITIIFTSHLLVSQENSNKIYPQDLNTSNKWWSIFFASVHKKITKKAFEMLEKDKNEFPDIFYFKNDIIDGSSDEDGHPTPEHCGGDVYSIWFSSKIIYDSNNNIKRRISVLRNYQKMNFNEAYENIGAIVHLTQDQAVPPHALNILHPYWDQFERYYFNEKFDEVDPFVIDESYIPDNLNPWEYYQWVQDDTRKNARQWKDPETGEPYWVEAKDAPPLGKDATYGPHGSYGGGKDHFGKYECTQNIYGKNECRFVPKSPQIRQRQLAISAVATMKLLKSASKSLPPLIRDIRIKDGILSFKIYENRCQFVEYRISHYNGKEFENKKIDLDTNSFPYSKTISFKLPLKGRYLIEITDCDGNKEKTEVINGYLENIEEKIEKIKNTIFQ
jgi:hypothetical protein